LEAWQGVPPVLLYDNLKSAVLERRGDAIRFHPTLVGFAGHYRYEPRPVSVARGNEKGRVERAIRYVRDAFFAARLFNDLDDLNAHAEAWCNGLAAERRCPEELGRSVREVFPDEAPRLLPLPDNPAPLLEHVAVSVGKTAYVRFDLNNYSVPHTHVRRVLTVLADPHEVRVVDGGAVLACHRRSYDRGAQIEQADHVEALVEQKRAPVSTAPPIAWSTPKPDPVDPRRRTRRQSRCHHRRSDAPAGAGRYQNESTLITTNRAFGEWNEVFANAACVVSLVDRLVHNAEIVASKANPIASRRASPEAARIVLDGCEHDGTLIAETDDECAPRRCRPARADQDAPVRRGFPPPLTLLRIPDNFDSFAMMPIGWPTVSQVGRNLIDPAQTFKFVEDQKHKPRAAS
jgi:hypothetical protein